MNYLEKLKKKISLHKELSLLPKVKNLKKEPTLHTAFTAKSIFGTLDSSMGSHFPGNKKEISETFSLPKKNNDQINDLWNHADELADWIDNPVSDVPWQERVAKVPELQKMSAEIDRLKSTDDFSPIPKPHRKVQIDQAACPARCKLTGRCYGIAYFDAKPGKALLCMPDQCLWSEQLKQYFNIKNNSK